MRGTQTDPLAGVSLDPSAKNTAARKSQHLRTVGIDDRQLQIAIEWRGRYLVPHNTSHKKFSWTA